MSPVRIAVVLLLVPVGILAGAVYVLGSGAPGAEQGSPFIVRDFPGVVLDESRSRPQGDVWRGAVPEPKTLNPLATQFSVVRRMVLRYTHDGLTDLDPETGQLRPCLASSYRRDEGDVRLWWFELREAARFDDGSEIGVGDVAWTLAAALAEGAVPNQLGAALAGVEFVAGPPDAPRTFGLLLPRTRQFDAADVFCGFRVLQQHWFELRLREVASLGPDEPVPQPGEARFVDLVARVRSPGPSTGPYRLAGGPGLREAWIPGRSLHLVQNPLCWQRTERPESWNLAGMSLSFGSDRVGQWAALLRRELDWIVDVGDADARYGNDPDLRRDYRLVEYVNRSSNELCCVWNHHIPALQKVEVRRALTMLFDRQAIVDHLLDGRGRVATSWLPLDHPAYPRDLQPLPFSPDRARSLLSKEGYTDDAPLELRVLTDGAPPFGRIADGLIAAARECGNVSIEVVSVPWQVLEARYNEFPRGHDAGVLMVLGHSLSVDPVGRFGPGNLMGFEDARNAELLGAVQAASDVDARTEALATWSRYLHRSQPIAVLAHPKVRVLLHRRFKMAEPSAAEGLIPERWWVPRDQQLVFPRER